MNDDELQFAFAHALKGAQPGDDCPPPTDLLDALTMTLPTDRRTAIVDHLAECPVCAEAWRILMLNRPEGSR